jgi:hypothetical protein
VSISNDSPYLLSGCFLRYKSGLYSVGDIPPGGSVERTFVDSEAGGDGELITDPRRLSLYRVVRDGFDREKPLLFAWLDASVFGLENRSFVGFFSDKSVNLLAVEAE